MILELKRTCLECIDRIEHKMCQINEKQRNNITKHINQILFSISNEVILLKDNFTLIMNKITRL